MANVGFNCQSAESFREALKYFNKDQEVKAWSSEVVCKFFSSYFSFYGGHYSFAEEGAVFKAKQITGEMLILNETGSLLSNCLPGGKIEQIARVAQVIQMLRACTFANREDEHYSNWAQSFNMVLSFETTRLLVDFDKQDQFNAFFRHLTPIHNWNQRMVTKFFANRFIVNQTQFSFDLKGLTGWHLLTDSPENVVQNRFSGMHPDGEREALKKIIARLQFLVTGQVIQSIQEKEDPKKRLAKDETRPQRRQRTQEGAVIPPLSVPAPIIVNPVTQRIPAPVPPQPVLVVDCTNQSAFNAFLSKLPRNAISNWNTEEVEAFFANRFLCNLRHHSFQVRGCTGKDLLDDAPRAVAENIMPGIDEEAEDALAKIIGWLQDFGIVHVDPHVNPVVPDQHIQRPDFSPWERIPIMPEFEDLGTKPKPARVNRARLQLKDILGCPTRIVCDSVKDLPNKLKEIDAEFPIKEWKDNHLYDFLSFQFKFQNGFEVNFSKVGSTMQSMRIGIEVLKTNVIGNIFIQIYGTSFINSDEKNVLADLFIGLQKLLRQ